MTTHTDTPISVTVLDKADAVEFHVPGCSHQHRRAVREAAVSERTLGWLQGIQDEAKSLGSKNPIAPCLRKVIR